MRISGAIALIAVLIAVFAASTARADVKIVVIGASNTSGYGTGYGQSFPSQLEAMLKARGYKVQVLNGGIPGDTTRGMLGRVDALPEGTRIVILQPGGNDKRFGYSKEERAKNIREIVSKLQKRGIRVIVADNLQGLLAKHSADGIHFNGDAHAMIAKRLYPQVVSALGGGGTPATKQAEPGAPSATPASVPAAGGAAR